MTDEIIVDFDKTYQIGEHQYGILYAQVKNKLDNEWSIRVIIASKDEYNTKWKMICWLNEIEQFKLASSDIIFDTKEKATAKLEELAALYNWKGYY